MSIEVMEQAIEALNEAVAFREGGLQKAIDAINALRTAIQQAEAKTDVRCEGCGYMTHHREHMGCVRAAKQFTHPDPGVPDALKDHQIAAMVNSLRDIALQFHGHGSLRERIANVLVPALKTEARTGEPVQVFLVRDVASLLGASVPDVCDALAELGYEPRRSTNAAISPDEAIAVAKRINPAPGEPVAVAGELDPLRAYEFGQLITKYSESFNGQKWGGVYDSVDRKNLAVALDHLTEAGAMLMNISERLLRTNPAPAASVTDDVVRDAISTVREQYRGTDCGKAAEGICDAIDAAIAAALGVEGWK